MDNRQSFIESFIDIYRSFPCLWKIKDDTYSNKKLKEAAYEKLLQHYRTIIPDATIDNVKKKINNLRSSFRKELKKVKQSKSGSSADDYTPTLWYYNLLLFSADQEVSRASLSSDTTESETSLSETQINDESNESDNIFQLTTTPLPPHPTTQPSTRTPLPSHSPTILQPPPQRLTPAKRKKKTLDELQKSLYQEDEYDGIGVNVACKLRRMEPEQRMNAESLINSVLMNGLKHRLQEGTMLIGLAITQSLPQTVNTTSRTTIQPTTYTTSTLTPIISSAIVEQQLDNTELNDLPLQFDY